MMLVRVLLQEMELVTHRKFSFLSVSNCELPDGNKIEALAWLYFTILQFVIRIILFERES